MSHSAHGGASPRVHAANRQGLDYAAEAGKMPAPAGGIIDVHAHINGPRSAAVYRRAARLYGVRRVYSMTQLEHVEAVRAVLGDMVRFIAVPSYSGADRRLHHGPGFIERIRAFHALGARVVKFWAAPRGRDYGREAGEPGLLHLDAPMRIAAMETAASLGMVFMAHVADPDTWFATKYRDASIYGTKREHYEPLEVLADRFRVPWIVAHMGGSPENLEFLTGLLERHDNIHLDTSAAKWMIRELGRHDRGALVEFFNRFRGRIHFGTDIVAEDAHLQDGSKANEMLSRANSESEAFDLYAGRYWALRTMFETNHHGPSPIADPDLSMIDPERYGPMDAPILSGKSLPAPLLRSIYFEATRDLLE
jgi:hypothetical protein